MIEKRYQVFISSTYTDLYEERNEVMQALLELECMPAGMELFPAANDTQWDWIKKVIDESDYYMVIIGGRYGSVHPQKKLSYTEMEYRYALETNKPIISFLHENPMSLSFEKSESDSELRIKLEKFRELVKEKLCKTYSNPSDLGAKVSRSITQLKKQFPAEGWVRARSIKSRISEEDYLNVLKKNEELEERIRKLGEVQVSLSQKYASGNDIVILKLKFDHRKRNPENNKSWLKQDSILKEVSTTWNEIFEKLASSIISSNYRIFSEVESFLSSKVLNKLYIDYDYDNHRFDNESLMNTDRILHQFRVLGLISIQGRNWKLTEYGENYFNNLIAIPKGKNCFENE